MTSRHTSGYRDVAGIPTCLRGFADVYRFQPCPGTAGRCAGISVPLRGFSLAVASAATGINARSYPRRIPLALKRARGIHVEDVEGRQFIDCLAGAGTLALGHNHPVVVEAIQRVLADELPLHTLDLTTPVKDRFVQDLFAVLPEALRRDAKIQFCGPTGTDAVEAALKLVRTATGRSTVLAFQGPTTA